MVDANEHFLYLNDHANYARRHYLTQLLREETGSVVRHGILKGYRIGPALWAEAAVGTYLLGTYEPQVCAILDSIKSPDRTLIDIGAADGLYGVGLVAVGAFGRSLCFEASEASRDNFARVADAAGVADRVAIHGAATPTAIRDAIAAAGVDLARTVVLCDIEGGEFDLFDDALLAAFADAHLIIETHDFLLKDRDGGAELSALKARAAAAFNVHEVRDGLRYIRDIPELRALSDADVWTMCAEGRKRMMTWLYLTPKAQPPLTDAALDALIYNYQKAMVG